ncbi:hypothetical protein Tco_1088366 [Tanacetum coccineum]
MIAYLERPTDSDDFTEIVDFLNTNHRIGKDFSGKVTPLFDTMLIQHQSEVGDSLERAATTASSLEVEHVSGNITKTRSKATLNEPTPQGTGSGSGPRRQDTMRDIIARTKFKNVSKTSYDSQLGGVYTPRSDEDRDYKPEKEGQEARTKRKVKNSRVEKVGTSRRVESSTEASLGNQGDASKQGRNICKIDADVDISLVHEDAGIYRRFDDEDMFDTSVFNDEEVFARQDMADQEVNVAEKEVSVADPVTTAGEVILVLSMFQ